MTRRTGSRRLTEGRAVVVSTLDRAPGEEHHHDVPVQLNHHIVHARDPEASAHFLSEMLGLAPPTRFGHFHVVHVDNGVSLDYMGTDDETYLVPNHYAFLVTEAEFDEIFGRILERGLEHFADPFGNEPGTINHHFGGRGVYWADPDGHWLEIITVPYGGWDGTTPA